MLARSEADVMKAIRFATNYHLAISVFGTGHEFNDRNAGQANNSLLIRTMCLRTADIDLKPSEYFDHKDGTIRVGSGMTWGTSKMGDTGVHELAYQVDRVVVSGHAGNVGVVGWSLGGGHGQLAGTYGLGVDQVLQVEMVDAFGNIIIADERGTTKIMDGGNSTHSKSNDLFWALRGGGAGTWGVVTAMTIKLHKVKNECTTHCYTQWTAIWEGNWYTDGPELLQDLIHQYLKWTGTASKFWSSYAFVYPKADNVTYGFYISEALYVGKESTDSDYWGFQETFQDLYPEQKIVFASQKFDTFLDKLKVQTDESVSPLTNFEPMVTVLMNKSSVADPLAAEMVVRNWFPRCVKSGGLCVAFYLFMHTLSTGSEDDEYTETAVSPAFRQAKLHLAATSYTSLIRQATLEEKVEFAHNEIGPEFYR